MNHHTTRRPATVTTVAVLAALILGATLGLPAGLYAITRDAETTGRTLILAGVITGTAATLICGARIVKALHRSYRRQP